MTAVTLAHIVQVQRRTQLPWGELCPNEGYLYPASLSRLVHSTAVSLLLDVSLVFFFFYPFLKGLASQGIFKEMRVGRT